MGVSESKEDYNPNAPTITINVLPQHFKHPDNQTLNQQLKTYSQTFIPFQINHNYKKKKYDYQATNNQHIYFDKRLYSFKFKTASQFLSFIKDC